MHITVKNNKHNDSQSRLLIVVDTEHSILLRVGRNEILNASGEECQGWKAKLVEFQANKSICTRGQGGTIIMDVCYWVA
jgi:hypothetical protein